MKTYRINEVFYSIQGEGARTGTANVFVRFAGCNLTCNREEHGFDCDTEFSGGTEMDADDIAVLVESLAGGCRSIIWTGGEPTLQLDDALLSALSEFYHCIETNGTNTVPSLVDWISCSPKTAEHTLRCGPVQELRYVRAANQALPRPRLDAKHKFLSPAFLPTGEPDMNAVRWCQQLVLENPEWRLSLQTHKLFAPMR